MRQILLLCFEASKPSLWSKVGGGNGSHGHLSFNVFGFDFMIDDAFKVWLIEVNSSPGVAKQLLHPLARSLIHTAVEPVFPPQRPPAPGKPALPRSHSWSVSGRTAAAANAAAASPTASHPTTDQVHAQMYPTTNPDGLPCCGRECCLWGFERVDTPRQRDALLGAATSGRGVARFGTVGAGVGRGVNVPVEPVVVPPAAGVSPSSRAPPRGRSSPVVSPSSPSTTGAAARSRAMPLSPAFTPVLSPDRLPRGYGGRAGGGPGVHGVPRRAVDLRAESFGATGSRAIAAAGTQPSPPPKPPHHHPLW